MKEFSVTFKEQIKRVDLTILFCALFMTTLSILTLSGDIQKFTLKRVVIQSVAALIGIGLMILISMFDYDTFIQKLVIPIFFVSVFLLILVKLIGKGDGNTNWIEIPGLPVDIQPSEFVKIFFIITFSKHIDLVKNNINHIKNVAALALHAGVIIGLILITGDLGSALVYIAIMAAMLFAAGLSLWYFVIGIVVIVIAVPYFWNFLADYQKERIIYGFNPEGDPLYRGYQALLSRRAISSGGFRGAGMFGGSIYKLIPIAESDFLFAVMCEKFGFLGAFFYMTCMSVMILRILYIARTARKDYGSYICVGVVAIFIAQALENIGMCLAMLPVIGITLPFLSYGGSSMLSMYLCLGVVQSIHTHNKKYYFEREGR